MITSITFAQKKNQIKSNNQNTKKVNAYMKIDDIKGESTDKSRKANYIIKIADIQGESKDKSSKRVTPFMKIGEIQGESQRSSKTTTRRRVVVAKSNK